MEKYGYFCILGLLLICLALVIIGLFFKSGKYLKTYHNTSRTILAVYIIIISIYLEIVYFTSDSIINFTISRSGYFSLWFIRILPLVSFLGLIWFIQDIWKEKEE